MLLSLSLSLLFEYSPSPTTEEQFCIKMSTMLKNFKMVKLDLNPLNFRSCRIRSWNKALHIRWLKLWCLLSLVWIPWSHGPSQDFFGGEHFFKKFSKNSQKIFKKLSKIFKKIQKLSKNIPKIQKSLKNIQKIFKNKKNFKKFSKKFQKNVAKFWKIFLRNFLKMHYFQQRPRDFFGGGLWDPSGEGF